MKSTGLREKLRTLLESDRCVIPASIFDPISARLAENLSFEVCALAGSVTSFTVAGSPDMSLITASELAEQSSRIARSIKSPLVVDGDHGYGNALNVIRTVEMIESSGAAALIIEDTELPQVFGQASGLRLISCDEARKKMEAALSARDDHAFVIAGRTAVDGAADLRETITRVSEYTAAGVDAVFVTGVKTREQLDEISAHTRIPLFVGPGGDSNMRQDLSYLASRRVRLCYRGIQPFLAAIDAVNKALGAVRDVSIEELNRRYGQDLLKEVTQKSKYDDVASRYL